MDYAELGDRIDRMEERITARSDRMENRIRFWFRVLFSFILGLYGIFFYHFQHQGAHAGLGTEKRLKAVESQIDSTKETFIVMGFRDDRAFALGRGYAQYSSPISLSKKGEQFLASEPTLDSLLNARLDAYKREHDGQIDAVALYADALDFLGDEVAKISKRNQREGVERMLVRGIIATFYCSIEDASPEDKIP